MPLLREYRVFISHAWNYSQDYYTIVDWVENSRNLKANNYSVPEHDPLDADNTTKLKSALTTQISQARLVLVIAGMYAAHSDWIEYELDEAIRMDKNIVGIRPQGQERIPRAIQDVANEIIYWRQANVVNAVRKYG